MRVFNWHIIHDSELRKLREMYWRLKRVMTDKEIDDILEGRAHYHRNPKRKEA